MSNKPNRRPSTGASSRVASRPSAQPAPNRMPWIIGAAVLVIVVALGVAVLVSRSGGQTATGVPAGATVVPKTELAFGEVSVQGTPLPEMPQGGGTDPAIGMKAPTVTSNQFDGTKLTLPAPGKPAVIAFVAHWCPHCQKEVPLLADYLASAGLPGDVNLYAVATGTNDQRPNYPPSAWLNKEKWAVPTIADNQQAQIAQAYGLTSYPYFVAVDAQGNVVARTSGELTIEQFQQLLASAKTPVSSSGSAGTSVSGTAGAASAR